MGFAAWIRETRRAKGYSQVECATRAGVSHPTWVEYENTTKTAQPRRHTVQKVAEALDVPLQEAMIAAGYFDSKHGCSEGIRRLECIINQAPEHKRRDIETALETVARTLVSTSA